MNKPEAAGRLREIKVQTYRTLGTAINRFHIVSLTFLFVLLILVLNKDFTQSKWSVADSRLRSWLSAFDQHPLTLALEYRLVVDSEITESVRKTLTQSILASGIADSIPDSLQMSKVSKFLGDKIYGVDFVELPKLEAALNLMEEQEGASILQDLSRFHYEGGPYVRGTTMKDYFFSLYKLGLHRDIAEQFPYVANMPIVEYIKSVRMLIDNRKIEYKDAYHTWSAWTDEFLEKFKLRDWTWHSWQKVSDESVKAWHSLLADTVGPIDQATLISLAHDRESPDWGSVINWLRNEVEKGLESEDKAKSKVEVWSIDLPLPLGLILLVFPILFVGSRCILALMIQRQRITLIEAAKLDEFTNSNLGISLGGALSTNSVLRTDSKFELIKKRQWSELFDAYPTFLLNGAYAIAAWLVSIYIFTISIRIAATSDSQLHSSWDLVLLVGSTAIATLMGVSYFIMSRRLISDAKEREIGNQFNRKDHHEDEPDA